MFYIEGSLYSDNVFFWAHIPHKTFILFSMKMKWRIFNFQNELDDFRLGTISYVLKKK